MKMHSLAARLTLLQQIMAAVVIVTFAASSLWLTDRTLRNDERRLLLETARRVADAVDEELRDQKNLPRAAANALREETGVGVRIDAFDAGGQLLASTAATPERPAPVSLPAPGTTQEAGGLQRAAARSASGALVVASVSSRVRTAHVSALARALLWGAVPLFLFTVLISRWTARRALRPLEAMDERARNASVDVGVRSLGEPTGIQEMDRLGASFNRLLERLDDRLSSERRFTSDASHELRTPLTVVSGELEVALASRSLAPEIRAGLERAIGQVGAMRELVEALLLLRRSGEETLGGESAFEPVNLSDIASDAVRAVRRRHPERDPDLTLTAPDEVMVSGHPNLLGSAIGNLLDNAVKFTQVGERVRVTVETEAEDTRLIVDDAGRGVPEEERERVFDPFFRGAESRADQDGFGLGLPILRQVARAHGGDVTVGDSPLGGARFTLCLPVWSARGGS